MESRRPGLIGPLILITAGVLFLLANLDLLPFTFWEIAARFWPLLLILIGLDILIGRRSVVGAVIVLILWLALIGGAIWLASPQGRAYLPSAATVTDNVVQPLGDIKSASLSLDNGISSMTVNSLASDPANLVQGTFRHPQGTSLLKTYNTFGSEGRLALSQQGTSLNFWLPTESEWVLGLNPQIPIALSVNSGVGRVILDLNGLTMTTLNINSGVGSINVTTPGSGNVTMRLNGGVGSANITIPSGVAASIDVNRGLGSINVNETRFPRFDSNTFRSTEYATAANRMDIEVDGGLGSINIR